MFYFRPFFAVDEKNVIQQNGNCKTKQIWLWYDHDDDDDDENNDHDETDLHR